MRTFWSLTYTHFEGRMSGHINTLMCYWKELHVRTTRLLTGGGVTGNYMNELVAVCVFFVQLTDILRNLISEGGLSSEKWSCDKTGPFVFPWSCWLVFSVSFLVFAWSCFCSCFFSLFPVFNLISVSPLPLNSGETDSFVQYLFCHNSRSTSALGTALHVDYLTISIIGGAAKKEHSVVSGCKISFCKRSKQVCCMEDLCPPFVKLCPSFV